MAILRRLLLASSLTNPPLKSAFSRSYSSYGIRGGLGMDAFRRDFTVEVASEELRRDEQVSGRECEDEIERFRREFEELKRSFHTIPAALKAMPKMNPEGIYVNKNLKLGNIQVYGFDYDYTLAHYSENLQSLIYDLAKEYLVDQLKYPESCMQFEYDRLFPIRGLYYDRLKGCLLKLDFFGSIEPDGCYFGRQKLSIEKIEEIYGTRHIGRDQAWGLVGLMDLFCFSEACLIADIVQHFVDAKLDFDASYVYQDVNHAIQHVHQSGLVHKTILTDPHKYLVKNSQVMNFLKMLKEKGKKLFLLTNSPFNFVDGGMRFMLQDYGDIRDSWRDIFDVVIARANKPNFHLSEHPFRAVNGSSWPVKRPTVLGTAQLFVLQDGHMEIIFERDQPWPKIQFVRFMVRCYDTEKDTLAFTAVDRFLPNQVYYHGCLKSFLQITKWKGPEVIYFGDHLFSDLRGPSKAGWRTAAIIHELENEIRIQNDVGYRFQQAKFHMIQEFLGKFYATVANCQEGTYGALLEEIKEERRQLRAAMRSMFNNSFGATFLTDTGRESAFAYHIHQYADVYTSKPENFLLYPPEAWLHVPFDIKIMPHHVKTPPSVFKKS